MNEVLLINYGRKNWLNGIPNGIIQQLREEKEIDIAELEIDDFFEELYLRNLKEITIYSDHYKYLRCLVKDLSKSKFIELMDELNLIRRKIAHCSSTFSRLDLDDLIKIVRQICQGEIAENLLKYIDNESYKTSEEIPSSFFVMEDRCPHNLPIEDYDLDGGFVGRKKEISKIKKLLYTDQDRIITIIGAGGIGKTAVALKTAYGILADEKNPFEAIIWFSAKESKLTASQGIVPIEPGIKHCEQLVKDILEIVDKDTLRIFEKNEMPYEKYKKRLYGILSSQKCLLVIDNLETVFRDTEIIEFIKDIPRPSQVLITSRRGFGEIERRYPLPEFNKLDAIKLFRLVSKERDRSDLLGLEDNNIANLVNRVKCYPLLIKWSIGKVCLGKDINDAFSLIHSGQSEVAEFVFNDVFELLSERSKSCIFSMIIFGDKPISKHLLMHLANLDDDTVDDAIRELTLTSFVYQDVSSSEQGLITNYSMLSLTRGFIQHKLDDDKILRNILQTRYYDLSEQIEQFEKSKSAYAQSLFSLGVKNEDEKIAFNYVKTAKNFAKKEVFTAAEENFEKAIKVAPEFPYALSEYAKFEFDRGHIPKSNRLFQQAIEVDRENYHSFFNYGIRLKRQNKLSEAIEVLSRAMELNPNHQPIYNHLGRVYSFKGEYEKANELFEKARQQEKFPNYWVISRTLQWQADNYRRWSEHFFMRNDHNEGFKKLFKALSLIEEAKNLNQGDRRIQRDEKNICKNIGINLCKIGKFEEARKYLNRCLKKIELRDGSLVTNDQEMAEAYYYLAFYGLEMKKLSLREIKTYVETGMAMNRKSNYSIKLLDLKRHLDREMKKSVSDVKWGIIEYVNMFRHYGIIRSENDTYLFFLNHIDKTLDDSEIISLKGRTVSFRLIDNPKKRDEKIGTDIHLEPVSDVKWGIIEYVNMFRHYGIIRSENDTYLFFLNHIDKTLDDSEIISLKGRTVSFRLIDNPKKRDGKIGTDIHLEPKII